MHLFPVGLTRHHFVAASRDLFEISPARKGTPCVNVKMFEKHIRSNGQHNCIWLAEGNHFISVFKRNKVKLGPD